MEGSQDPSSLARTRARIYDFLGSVYLKAPDLNLVKKLMNEPLVSEEFQGMAMLREFRSRSKLKSPEEVQENLAVEHSKLFRGITHGYGPPPPYESVWVGEGTVMGAPTIDVVKSYAEAGLELTGEITEPPDHVGIELGYISYLCNKEADAWKNNNTADAIKCLHMEQRFLNDHVQKWVPSFCEKIMQHDETEFYHGIAMITKEYLRHDDKTIEELLGTLERD